MDIFRRPRQYDMGSSGGSDNTGAGQAITGIGNNIAQKTAMTPQQQAQYSGSFDIGQYLQQLFGSSVGMPGTSAQGFNPTQQYENQGPLNQAIYNNVLNQAQNPSSGWQSTLQPQLQQAQTQIDQYYNSRGLDNSGISIGASGQAGVDLAIANAQNEMAYQQQSLQNANSLSGNINAIGQQNIGNLSNLYNQQQGYGLQGQQMANQGLYEAAGYQAYPQQAALGNYYGGQAALGAIPGQLIGAAGKVGAAALTGGASIPWSAMASGLGNNISSSGNNEGLGGNYLG